MKLNITLLAALIAPATMAQVVTLRDTADNVVNGTTVIVYGNSTTPLLELDLNTELNGSAAKTINVRRHELNVVTGSKNYFCWGLCYIPRLSGNTPTWVSDDSILMTPQQEVDNFHAYYRPEGTTAYCCFQYVWYDMANPNDSTWVNICFDTQTFTSVQEVSNVQPAITAYPNPALQGDVTLAYELGAVTSGAQLVVYNTLGARAMVRPLSVASGRATVPASMLAPGMWFAVIEQNGRMLATRRFVVGR